MAVAWMMTTIVTTTVSFQRITLCNTLCVRCKRPSPNSMLKSTCNAHVPSTLDASLPAQVGVVVATIGVVVLKKGLSARTCIAKGTIRASAAPHFWCCHGWSRLLAASGGSRHDAIPTQISGVAPSRVGAFRPTPPLKDGSSPRRRNAGSSTRRSPRNK